MTGGGVAQALVGVGDESVTCDSGCNRA